MESQQVPNDGLRSQYRSHVVLAETATSFHRFRYLPVELQLDIWDHAFPPSARSPKVLCFKLKVCRDSQGLVACFNPDEHVASSTFAQRTLLAICQYTRHRALETLNVVTLFRFNESSTTAPDFRIPFDFQNTCLCIEGWEEHGIEDARFRNINGMDFARRVKRLAFVVRDNDVAGLHGRVELAEYHIRIGLLSLALLFHNATQIGRITKSMSLIRDSVTEATFASLFSFQSFTQKEMVEGVPLTKAWSERTKLFRAAMPLAFQGWRERLRAALPRDGSSAS